MPQITFFGRVLPERVPITFQSPPYQSNFTDLGISYEMALSIHLSQITATITLDQQPNDMDTLRNLVAADVRGSVDLFGYLSACSFDVEMICAVEAETKNWWTFGINIPVLSARRQPLTSVKGEFLLAVGSNTAAQAVLAYFREAIRIPVDTGFFCYRAIEGMMQSMKTPPSAPDGDGWRNLRENLNVDRTALDAVKRHADLPRHGRISSIKDGDRAQVFIITDDLIARYLQYLVTGQAVDRKVFPLLKI